MKNQNREQIKVEWCENWIKARFKKMPEGITGIERSLFFKEAEKAGLYVPGTYGSPMSEAMTKLLDFKAKHDENGEVTYFYFQMLPEYK